ncbi:MAG: AraC family transcriptional regulator [Roseburia sp.]
MDTRIVITSPTVISALVQHRSNFYKFGKHLHSNMELYHFLTGQCKMDIGNQVITCHKGDVVLLLPNIVHSFYLDTAERCTFHHIHFTPDLYSNVFVQETDDSETDLMTTFILKNHTYFKTKADERLSGLILSIVEKAASKTPSANAYMNLNLLELMLYVLEKSECKALSTERSQTKNEYVSAALTFIQKNYATKLLIRDISNHLNISSRYLSKIFFEHMNVTIGNYLNNYRINQSIDLMRNTDMTLTEIAAQVGLKDSQHFSKLFKSIIGINPHQYRKLEE